MWGGNPEPPGHFCSEPALCSAHTDPMFQISDTIGWTPHPDNIGGHNQGSTGAVEKGKCGEKQVGSDGALSRHPD